MKKIILLTSLAITFGCSGEASVSNPDASTSNDTAASDTNSQKDTTNTTDVGSDITVNDMASETGSNRDASNDVVDDVEIDLGPTPPGCFDYAAFTDTNVSFRNDVMPIFAQRCSGCHNDENRSAYYGEGGTTEAEAVAVRDGLLNKTPVQAPNLDFVAPNDPVRSYMLAKVEYDDPGGTCSVVVCSLPGCDIIAPPSGQLPANELGILRSWVIRGALDN